MLASGIDVVRSSIWTEVIGTEAVFLVLGYHFLVRQNA